MRFLYMLFLSVVIMPLGAQEMDEVRHSRTLGIALGWTGYQVRDEVLTPIRHDGQFPSLSVFHRKAMPEALREIHADFVFNPLSSRFEDSDDVNSVASNLTLSYRYLLRIHGDDSGMKVYAGPIVGMTGHLGYYNLWDESHIFWLNTYFLGLDARLNYPTSDRTKLTLDVYMPLLGLGSRPPERFFYKQLDPRFFWIVSRLHDDLTLTTLNRHMAVNAYLEYVISIGDRYKQGVFWKASYVRNSLRYSRNINIIISTLGIRLYF